MKTIKKRSLDAWQAADAAHYLHPFTDHGALRQKGSRIITRGEGIYIYDITGHKILDGMSGLWCVNLGYGRQELIDAATQQMQELPFYNSFFQCAHPPAIRLAELIAEISPAHMNQVFFTGSGSEANDTVLRMVRYYWALQGQAERQIVISRENAYHGSTMAGASLGGMSAIQSQGGLPIPGIEHICQPYHFEYQGNKSADEFGLECARALKERIETLGPEKVAAFIGEPIQGAGGVIIPPASYWPAIQKVCDEYGILLVADEVITGFGRTGHWFASDYYGIKPDLMPIAKGMTSGYLPMGGVVVADRVAEVLQRGGEFYHGFTYSGHPTCAAVAIRNIEIMRDEKIVDHVRDVAAPHLAKIFRKLGEHPIVGEARSLGLLGALELVSDKKTRKRFEPKGRIGELCRDLAVDNGVVMRHVGESLIVAPPLISTVAQIDELAERAWKTLDDAARLIGTL
ncbi:MAG: aspartate aminotransferase family protein [Pseudomonadales bacterium]|nr:aspartate aminotransferase family protein [Pseudomonadales bacterium]